MKEKLNSILKEIYDTTPKNEVFQVVNELLEYLKVEAKKICRECGSTKIEFYTRNRICKRCYSIQVQQKKKDFAQKHGFETYYQYLKHTDYQKLL